MTVLPKAEPNATIMTMRPILLMCPGTPSFLTVNRKYHRTDTTPRTMIRLLSVTSQLARHPEGLERRRDLVQKQGLEVAGQHQA